MLITIEGIDGSGKSTILEELSTTESNTKDVVFTSEPYRDTNTEPLIRDSLEEHTATPTQLLYLYISNHIEHVESVIKPALNKQKTIICDRYYDSLLAYQSAQLESVLDVDSEPLLNDNTNELITVLEQIQNIGDYQVSPDLTLYIKISPETAVERIQTNRDSSDQYETKQWLSKVADKYQKLYESKDRFTVINGEQEKDEVLADCVAEIRKHTEFNPNIKD